MKKLLLSVLLFCLLPTFAFAQSQRNPCYGPAANSRSCISVTTATPMPVTTATNTYYNITTATNTVVKASPGTVNSVIINTAGTGSTAVIYDNVTCSGTKIATLSTTAQNVVNLNVKTITGICVTTTGSPAADITVTYN